MESTVLQSYFISPNFVVSFVHYHDIWTNVVLNFTILINSQQYDDKRVLFGKVKEEKKKAEEVLAQKKRRADPLEKELQAAIKTCRQLDQQKKNLVSMEYCDLSQACKLCN